MFRVPPKASLESETPHFSQHGKIILRAAEKQSEQKAPFVMTSAPHTPQTGGSRTFRALRLYFANKERIKG